MGQINKLRRGQLLWWATLHSLLSEVTPVGQERCLTLPLLETRYSMATTDYLVQLACHLLAYACNVKILKLFLRGQLAGQLDVIDGSVWSEAGLQEDHQELKLSTIRPCSVLIVFWLSNRRIHTTQTPDKNMGSYVHSRSHRATVMSTGGAKLATCPQEQPQKLTISRGGHTGCWLAETSSNRTEVS